MYNKLRILGLNLDDRLYMVYAIFKFDIIGEIEWHVICGIISQIIYEINDQIIYEINGQSIYEINGQSIYEINGETFLKRNVGNKIKFSILLMTLASNYKN